MERTRERIINNVLAIIAGIVIAFICDLTKGEMLLYIMVSYISYEFHDFYNEYIRNNRK